MAATCTHRVITPDTGNTPNTSGSINYASGDLLVVFITKEASALSSPMASGDLTVANVTGVSSFTLIRNQGHQSSAAHMGVFVADQKTTGSGSTGTVTIAGGSDAGAGTIISVYTVAGLPATSVGASAVRQSGGQTDQAAGVPAPAFGSAAKTENPVLGAIYNATNPAGMTSPSGWSAGGNSGYTTGQVSGLGTCHRNSGETGTTITWGSSSASAFASIIIELSTFVPGAATQALTADFTTQGKPNKFGRTTADFTLSRTTQSLTLTGVAKLSLASGSTPATRTDHAISVKARVTAGTGRLFARLYEGTTPRSGILSQALSTTLTTYSLAIADADAATISSYSDLELRIWGGAEDGAARVFEVSEASLSIPAAEEAATGAATQALTATFTTAGKVTAKGATTQALTLTSTTAGRLGAKGSATQALTLTEVTQAKVTMKGRTSGGITNLLSNGGFESGTTGWTTVGSSLAVDQPGALFGANLGEIQTNGAASGEGIYATFTATAAVYTLSVYLKDSHDDGASVRLAVRDNAGDNAQLGTPVVLTSSYQRLTFTTTALTAATWRFYIETSAQSEHTVEVDGAQVQIGSVATSYIETDGAPATRFSMLDITTLGKRGHLGASTAAYLATLTTAGKLGAKGATTQALTLSLTTQGYATAKGQVVLPLTLSLTSQAYATRLGQVVLPFTLDFTTQGTSSTPAQTWYGASVLDLVLALTSNGTRALRGQVVLPLTFTEVTSGKVGAKGAATQALTLGLTTQGKLTAKGQVVLPLTLDLTTAGRLGAKGQVVVPLTLTFTTEGQVKGKVYGASAMALVLALTSQGYATKHGQVILPFTWSSTSQGFKTTRGQVALPFTWDATSNGYASKTGAASLPLSLSITSAGSALVRGRSDLGLLLQVTSQGLADHFGQVLLPLTLDLDTAGHAEVFATAEELALLLDIITTGRREGAPVTELEAIISGMIAGTDMGGFPSGGLAHISDTVAGLIEEEVV